MELLIGAAIYAIIIQKMWSAARTDHEFARQGKVSPRLEAKYGSAQAARAKVEAYGFTDFLKDAYHDFWGRRGDALAAARAAEPPPGELKVRLRDRLAAASAALARGARTAAAKVAASPAVQKLIRPVERQPDTAPEPAPVPLAVDAGDVDEGTRRFNGRTWEEYRGGQWLPVPKQPDTPHAPPATPLPKPKTSGGAVTAPTGEAVNYETAISELDKLAEEQQKHLDACIAAQAALAAAKGHIGDMQDSYRASAAAAASTHEHLDALHLDSATLGHTGTTADAMQPGAVDTYFDALEALEEMARVRREAAEIALASTVAARKSIVDKYGDAHTTVAGELSGDSRFLDASAPAAA